MPRTANVYVPSGSPLSEYGRGLVQPAQSDTIVAPRTRRHSNVSPAPPVKPHCTLRLEPVAPGTEPIEGVTGTVVSSTKLLVTWPLRLPALSKARTANV